MRKTNGSSGSRYVARSSSSSSSFEDDGSAFDSTGEGTGVERRKLSANPCDFDRAESSFPVKSRTISTPASLVTPSSTETVRPRTVSLSLTQDWMPDLDIEPSNRVRGMADSKGILRRLLERTMRSSMKLLPAAPLSSNILSGFEGSEASLPETMASFSSRWNGTGWLPYLAITLLELGAGGVELGM